MSDTFLTENFLLETDQAVALYHDYARDLPIVDYHCHLPPDEVARDQRFDNLTHIWIKGDHYKWRAMRSNGVPERLITGDASDWDKFLAWAQTAPYTLRNPLYHWTHLELRRPLGISDRLLNPDTARSIWEACNETLAQPEFSARGIMRQMKVALVCTTDDPADSLDAHQAIAADGAFDVKVLPAWRPDALRKTVDVQAWNDYVDRLAMVAGAEIQSWDDLILALQKRHDFFHSVGCRLSDHGLDTVPAADFTLSEVRKSFAALRSHQPVSPADAEAFESALLFEFGQMDHKKNWTQQYHIGALRSRNTRMLAVVGRDSGYDSIDDRPYAQALARLLDRLDRHESLPKTILYNLNPAHNYAIATMIGNFQEGPVPGKIQMGSGWWFCDQLDGMTRQIEALSQLGLLWRFVGMLTDSRSFLSYARHEYFRRLLCNILGRDMAKGLLPNDLAFIGRMVRDISYNNAATYFGFPLSPAD